MSIILRVEGLLGKMAGTVYGEQVKPTEHNVTCVVGLVLVPRDVGLLHLVRHRPHGTVRVVGLKQVITGKREATGCITALPHKIRQRNLRRRDEHRFDQRGRLAPSDKTALA